MNLLSALKSALSIVGIAAVGFSSVAPAMAQFTAVHKFEGGGKSYVYFPGVAAGTTLEVNTPGSAAPKVLTLNNCGWGKFKESATSPVINITGSSVNFASISSGAAPTCTPGTTAGTYTDSNSSATVGTGIKTTEGYYWIKGGSTIGSATIEVTTRKKVSVKGNDCGWGRVAVSATRPMTNFSVASTNYTLAALPAADAPMVCRAPSTGAPKVNYVPAAGF